MAKSDELPWWFLALFVALGWGLMQGCSVFHCNQLARDTGTETRYTVFSGCLVKQGDGWIPEDKWRGVDGAKE